ncbi:response regulator [Cohnella mopanensis]|uniref:response regulator n=1 Tax=Cohnella mopanensis TaxID=2911966 RepID=UPI001EF75963|nr:response regulator [Cohnella mopanensis]
MDNRKITAIAVDDELNMRKLLQVLLDWNSLGFEFIGEAANGNEALDLIEAARPDIVFTDINMPYMDGLELAKLIKDRDPFIKVVILTAYPEFEYAKQSVKIGVHDFLLKPVQTDVLRKLAVELKEKIEGETAHWNEYRKIKTELLENSRELKEKFLLNLLVGNSSLEQLNRRYEYFYGASDPLSCSVAVIDVEAGNEDADNSMIPGLGCMRVVEFLVQEREAMDVVLDHGGRVVIVNRGDAADLACIGEQSVRAVREKLGYHATVGIGSVYSSLIRVKDSYKEALEALRYGQLFGGGQLISFGEDMRVVDPVLDLKLNEIEEIVFFVKAGIKEQAVQAIYERFQTQASARGETIEQAYSLGIHFVSSLELAMSELGFNHIRSQLLNGALYVQLFGCRTFNEINQLLSRLAEDAADDVKGIRNKRTNRIIDEVIAHLAEEFANPKIALSSVSERFHLNASYLSRIFKEETGQSFTDYLLKLRMDEALKLLNGTSLKAYQIAEKVGILDPYYFSHRFKKAIGVSVQEYKRNSHK